MAVFKELTTKSTTISILIPLYIRRQFVDNEEVGGILLGRKK
jgi:hypothetical protein